MALFDITTDKQAAVLSDVVACTAIVCCHSVKIDLNILVQLLKIRIRGKMTSLA